MYEAHFGLADLPFRIAPDPRFYVDTVPHRAAIRALLDGLGGDEEFTPLVGDFGIGKTTVVRRMLEEAGAGRHVTAELPRIRNEGDDLLDRVAEALGMRRPKTAPPMGSLIPQFEALARDGRDALLMVDEADGLGVGALNRLRKLTSVRVDGRASLHVFLVGRSAPAGLEQLLCIGRPLRLGAAVRVQPLDAPGTHEYILERLRRAGWSGRPAFDAVATAEIHARCQGNPGRINRLCGRVLLHLYMQGRHEVDAEVVRMVDELLQSELSGEPAAPAPPLPVPASPRAEALALTPSTDAADLDLDIEMPKTAAATAVARVQRPAEPWLPVPVAAASGGRGGGRRHLALARGVAVVALLVSGGVLWQAILRVASAYSQQTSFAAATAVFARHSTGAPAPDAAPRRTAMPAPAASAPAAPSTTAPPPAAADIVAQAEQSLSQSPPGAGQASSAEVVAASLRDSRRDAHDAYARRLPAHAGRTAPATRVAAQAPAVTCSIDGATLGLCDRPTARRAEPGTSPAAPRDTSAGNAPMAAPPACDPVRAALALCPEGTRTTP